VITIDDREDIEQDDEKDEEDELEAKVVVGKVPLYKERHQASNRQRDPRIRELGFEVRLAEKERLGLEQLAKVLPQITPNKKVQILSIFLLSAYHK
jgi:sentrin-specific protease 1